MFEHHRQSVEKMVEYFQADPDIIALVLGGSVAKGTEREDSDLDALVVVTDDKYEALKKENRLSEAIFGHCAYEKGYFDVKYFPKAYLMEVARQGSDPARAAWASAQVLYCRDGEIKGLIEKIPVYPSEEVEDKMLSYLGAFMLNGKYFWPISAGNPLLRTRAATDVVLFGWKMLLLENQVFFPCIRGLEKAVEALPNKPDGIVDLGNRLLTELTDEAMDAFFNAIVMAVRRHMPEDYSTMLSRYTEDNELWWYHRRPLIAEW